MIALPGEPQLPHAKGGTRADQRPYREHYDDETRERPARCSPGPIVEFGYEF